MRFPPSFLDEIKARVSVSEVVRHRVKLKRSGRELVGLSPFGQEKTPSFFVNDQKMAWFDFSSGKNGNVFDFLMATDGLTFPEAVERLAAEAGLALPARSPEREREEQRRASLTEVVEWAAAFFEAELRSPRGAAARSYLDSRKISAQSRADFRIGYAPADRHALRDALAARGASVEAMCETGLLVHGDGIAVPYDRFRDRIMFPIADRSGRVVAFGGRALAKDVQAKYLNSPETPLFHKGSLLFNQPRARKAAHDKGRVIVVEGYIDAIAMHAAGFPETVATLGTALGEEQAQHLWKMAPQPILCFDGDKAGRKAAYRAAEIALPLVAADRTFAFALLPGGQDPDEMIRAAGAAAMAETLDAAIPLVDLIWMRESERHGQSTPEQRAALERDLRAIAETIRDRSLSHHYWTAFRDRLKQLFEPQRGTGSVARKGAFRPAGAKRGGFRQGSAPLERSGLLSQPVMASASLAASPLFRQAVRHGTPIALPAREAMIMTILLAWPVLAAEHAEALAALRLGADLARLRDRLLDHAHDETVDLADAAALGRDLEADGFGPTVARLATSGAGAAWFARPDASVEDVARVLHQALTLHHMDVLKDELRAARDAMAADPSEANLANLVAIQEALNALPGKEASIEGFGAASARAAAAQ